MQYNAAINQYQGAAATPTVLALQAALLGKVFPTPPGAPQVFLVANTEMNAGDVSAHYDSGSNTITVTHNGAAPMDILDYMLFEVNNALNPKIAAAMGLSMSTAIGTVGATRAAAEYDTLKFYVRDLANAFAGGNPANFAGLVAGAHNLPAQALRTINTWIATYAPIYANYNVAGAAAFLAQPLAALLPLPPAAPAPAPGGAPQPIPADQAAILQFSSTPHNPGASQAGEQFYLAHLTSRQVYAYERVRAWNAGQLANYFTNMNPGFGNIVQNAVYRTFRDAWTDERRYHAYLFSEVVPAVAAQFPAIAIPVIAQFDAAMSAVATTEAARAISARWDSGDLSKVKPMVPWLAAGMPLRNAVDALRLAQVPPLTPIDLTRIR